MPVYNYRCDACAVDIERIVSVEFRDDQACEQCGLQLRKLLAAPLFRFAGQVTPGGGPDRFTADMLGVPLKDLPAGLKTDRP